MAAIVLLAALALAATDPQTQDSPPATKPAPKPTAPSTAVSGVTVNGAAAARPQVETSIDRRSYSVANDLQATTGSIGDVLRNIPSVQVDVQGNLSLRGDGNVTVLIDGKPSAQFQGDSLATALQTLPANQIDRVEVITNPSAEFRADGSAGIINLVTKRAKGAGSTGAVRIQASDDGQTALSANSGFNSDKLSVTDDIAYRRVHQISTLTSDQTLTGGESTNPSSLNAYLNSLQGHVGADYDLTPKTRLTGSVRLSYLQATLYDDGDYSQITSAGAPVVDYSRSTVIHQIGYNGELSAILRHKWADGNDITLNATYNGNEAIADRIDTTLQTVPAAPASADDIYRVNVNRHSFFTADYERPVGMDKLKLGYEFDYNNQFIEHRGGLGVPGAIAPDAGQTDNFADNDIHNQAYVTYEHQFGKLDALFGLRAESVHLALNQLTVHSPSDQYYNRLYPTLHLAYDLGGGKRWTASYSKRVNRPAPIQLDPFPSTSNPTVINEGNPNLRPQDTDSYELGFEQRQGAENFLATFYYRQTNDAFSFVATDLACGQVIPGFPQGVPCGVLLETSANVGAQKNGGLEVVFANKLTSKITYNLSADAYYTEVSAPNLGFTQTQQAFTGFGRANINWQVTPKDFVQFNIFANGKALLPQGYTSPMVSGNIGYRHTINNKVSWMIVAQDPFHTQRFKQNLNSFGGREVVTQTNNSRQISVTLVWNFSGKPAPQQQNFDFAPGGNAGGGGGPG
jgi:outer membrane receptor protein involved in Fe transport